MTDRCTIVGRSNVRASDGVGITYPEDEETKEGRSRRSETRMEARKRRQRGWRRVTWKSKSKGHIKRGTGHTPWKENASCNERSKWNEAVTKVCRAMSQHEGKEQQSKQWSGDAVVRRR